MDERNRAYINHSGHLDYVLYAPRFDVIIRYERFVLIWNFHVLIENVLVYTWSRQRRLKISSDLYAIRRLRGGSFSPSPRPPISYVRNGNVFFRIRIDKCVKLKKIR